jgi:hypothetical protein
MVVTGDTVIGVASVWNFTIHPSSATPPPPIKVILQALL